MNAEKVGRFVDECNERMIGKNMREFFESLTDEEEVRKLICTLSAFGMLARRTNSLQTQQAFAMTVASIAACYIKYKEEGFDSAFPI
jgi:hypothetical protein